MAGKLSPVYAMKTALLAQLIDVPFKKEWQSQKGYDASMEKHSKMPVTSRISQ